MKKTITEVEDLKASWSKDPIWDIEETEGFEEYREDLLKFRRDFEACEKAKHIAKQGKIYSMSLHDMLYFKRFHVIRVPGGWIYEFPGGDGIWDTQSESYIYPSSHGVFVPFDSEHQSRKEILWT